MMDDLRISVEMDILNITQATDLYIDNCSFNLVEFFVKIGKTRRSLCIIEETSYED